MVVASIDDYNGCADFIPRVDREVGQSYNLNSRFIGREVVAISREEMTARCQI